MNSSGFKVVAIISLVITLATLVGLLTEPIVGLLMMLGLGAYHIITALVLLFLHKRLSKVYRNLFFAYGIGVLAYFAISGIALGLGADIEDGAYVFAGFPMLLAISFVILKLGMMNSTEDTLAELRNDETILDM